MKTSDEYRQKKLLAELVENSAKIYVLVVKPKQTVAENLSCEQKLQELRARQKYLTERLHTLEKPISNAWENIGDGG